MAWRSVIGNFFESPISTCLIPGPRSVSTPQFPKWPAVRFAMVLESDQM